MHMADALLSPAVGTTFWAGSLGIIAYCAKKLKENIDEKMIPLMGVVAAFIFAAQMINFTIPATGSSGHIGGGVILAILLGPYAAFIAVASVLTIQCLFFADGGLLALGCNIWNMGLYPSFIAYPLIYKPIVKGGISTRNPTIASVLSVVAALQLGAFSVVIQTMLSGRSELPFTLFTMAMLPIHLAIGLVEGFITAGVVNYVRKERPELLESVEESRIFADFSIKRIVAIFAIMAIVTGGILSWFASTHPDGLEWSIGKIYGNAELPESGKGILAKLKNIQEKITILPDYNFPSGKDEKPAGAEDTWPAINAGTSLSGIIGSMIVLGMIIVLGFGIKAIKNLKFRNQKL